MILNLCFTIFSWYNYRHDAYKQTQRFFCYVSEVLTRHLFKNLHGYIPWKYCVLQILQNKRKNYYSFQGCSIIIWLDHMVLIFKNSNATACYLIFLWKLKRWEIIFRDPLKLLKKNNRFSDHQLAKLEIEIWNLKFTIWN